MVHREKQGCSGSLQSSEVWEIVPSSSSFSSLGPVANAMDVLQP